MLVKIRGAQESLFMLRRDQEIFTLKSRELGIKLNYIVNNLKK